jgi:phosphatidylinositol alpha-1,6-mannosyltransferase
MLCAREARLRGMHAVIPRVHPAPAHPAAWILAMTTSKRILMLTHEFPPYPGGVGRYCWNLAAAAARAGHRVKVLAPAHAQHRSDQYRDPPGVEVVHFAGDLFHFRELTALEQLVEDTLASDKWDLVHAADWPMIAACRHAKFDAAARVASLHGS